jgi:hypothetical protein
MIEWSWRVEGKRRIWCGTFSDGERWPRAFSRLEGANVASVTLYGRLPEIDLGLSNGLHLLSMMTAAVTLPGSSASKQKEHLLAFASVLGGFNSSLDGLPAIPVCGNFGRPGRRIRRTDGGWGRGW